MSDWVQVERTQLLEYVKYVELLIEDHNRVTEQLQNALTFASIIEKTWLIRLDALADVAVKHPSKEITPFEQGLLRAYAIMKGE